MCRWFGHQLDDCVLFKDTVRKREERARVERERTQREVEERLGEERQLAEANRGVSDDSEIEDWKCMVCGRELIGGGKCDKCREETWRDGASSK